MTPTLARLMGYDGLVINRIHHALKGSFKTSKNMEFIWRGYDVGQKDQTDMITHVLHTHYSAPQGFDWEEGAMSVDTNSASWRSNEFVNIMKVRSSTSQRCVQKRGNRHTFHSLTTDSHSLHYLLFTCLSFVFCKC